MTVAAVSNTAVSNTVLAHGAVLAKAKVPTDNVTPGVLGFLVVAALGVALYFLIRSMNRQLRKIPPPPPDPEDAEPGQAGAATGQDSAGQGSASGRPDLPDRLGQSPPAQRR